MLGRAELSADGSGRGSLSGTLMLSPGLVLTPKEVPVLLRLLGGASNKEIAQELHCSVRNVEFHVSNILKKNRSIHSIQAARRSVRFVPGASSCALGFDADARYCCRATRVGITHFRLIVRPCG